MATDPQVILQAGRGVTPVLSPAENEAIAQVPQMQRQRMALQQQAIEQGQALEDERRQRIRDMQALDAALAQPGSRDEIIGRLPGHLQGSIRKGFEESDKLHADAIKAQEEADDRQADADARGALLVREHGYDPLAAQGVMSDMKAKYADRPRRLQQIQQVEQAIQADPRPETVKPFVDALIKGSKIYSKLDIEAAQAVKQPTTASLAVAAAGGDTQAGKALELSRAPVKRTDAELALDAYAAFIGKPNAEALTYQDRQTFEQNKARITSDQAFQQHMRERQYDIAHPTPVRAADQNKLEQEARTVLQRAISSRSGGLGLEDQKVNQANHLLALFDQSVDPKTGTYNIPRVMQTELALGLARLMSPNGQIGIQLEQEINQRSLKGDMAGVATYVTGTPQVGNTQEIFKMFRDSIQRQGEVAAENREGAMAYLRNLIPTDLEEERRKKLESQELNHLRQSRFIQNTKTGERRVQVSLDGGVTWK